MSFGGDASRGRGLLLAYGCSPRARGHSAPTGDTPRVRGQESCPRRRRMPPAVRKCPWRCRMSPAGATRTPPRRMPLWAGPPQIEDVPFDRGLRSATEGDGPGAVVWGRSTFWAQNAVLDVPGRLCGAVVGTSQGLPRPRRSALPMRGCAVRRTGAAARRRRRYRSGPAGATSWWSSPRVRVLVAHDGLACQSRAAPA